MKEKQRTSSNDGDLTIFHYELSEGGSVCKTFCPYRMDVGVASVICKKCPFMVANNLQTQTLVCSHPIKENVKEEAKEEKEEAMENKENLGRVGYKNIEKILWEDEDAMVVKIETVDKPLLVDKKLKVAQIISDNCRINHQYFPPTKTLDERIEESLRAYLKKSFSDEAHKFAEKLKKEGTRFTTDYTLKQFYDIYVAGMKDKGDS